MAVTGKFYNTLEFGNVNSGDYGVYITGAGVYNAPARAVEMVSVPGRNGDVPIDMGHWDNIEVTYKCGLFGIDQSEMGSALMEFRNAIASQIGYQRLSDSYNPNEFRLGLFMAGLEFDAVSMNRAGEFELKFNCKPQRFLTDGEEMIDVKTDWSDLKTASGEVVTFEVADDAAANYTQFKSLVADIDPTQDLHGYDKPWVGGAGKNKLPYPYATESGTLSGITYNVLSDGSVSLRGTATSTVYLNLHPISAPFRLSANTYTVSGGMGSNVVIVVGDTNDVPIGTTSARPTFTVSEDTDVFVFVQITNGVTVDTVLHPQIESGSTATSYEPYSNICPISGWDSVEANVVGKNLLSSSVLTSGVYISNTNGEEVSYSPWSASGFIPAETGRYRLLRLLDGTYSPISGQNLYWAAYDAQRNYINGGIGDGINIESSTAKYIRVSSQTTFIANKGVLCKNDDLEYFKTEADYVDGTTYTATFDETVYGGEYDFVGGDGSVELAKATYDGSEAWAKDSDLAGGIHRFYVANNNIKKFSDYTNVLISNKCRATTNYQSAATMVDDFAVTAYNITINQLNWIYIFSKTIDTVDGIKAWLTETPLEVVYPLATARAIQLDPQTINTLVGVNNVWANSGDVSVEYGVRPGVLVNPTQYESSPVIEIEGTGSIGLNDYLIAIDGGSVGEVELASERRVEPILGGSYPSTITETIDMATTMSLLEDGDAFNISTLTASWLMGDTTKETYTITQQPTDGVASIETAASPRVSAVARFSRLAFAKGEAKTFAEEFIVSGRSSHGTGSVTFTVGVDYDGSHTLTITYGVAVAPLITGVVRSGSYSDIGDIIGNSSKQTFSSQVIIDSETGDAYRVEGGTYISLNKYIQLGAQLPTLRPGANVITYDDTIESLKIAPRWWRL